MRTRRNGWAAIGLATVVVSGAGVAARAEPSQAEVDAYIAADKNKDGHLSMAEFRHFVGLMARQGNSKARQIRFFRAYRYAFGIADRNRDGLIAPAELIKADAEN
jgi:Ca2+-binding EF-hand superfamily protein